MRDAGLMARKEAVIEKVKATFGAVKEALKSGLDPAGYLAPEGADFTQGQVSNGDRFQGMPWVYLDFPKYFSHDAIFTFRSFFWWGHGFVFALMLAGPSLTQYKANLRRAYDRLADHGLHLSLARDPWEWRQGEGYTIDLTGANRAAVEAALPDRPFLKLQSVLGFESNRDHAGLDEDAVVQAGRRAFIRCGPIITRS